MARAAQVQKQQTVAYRRGEADAAEGPLEELCPDEGPRRTLRRLYMPRDLRDTARMGHAPARARMTEAEYLAFERSSPDRHEFADGEIFAMSGGTGEHSALAANMIGELRSALFGRRCRVHTSDMGIFIPNPSVIVEVLSESTEAYDRGDKFEQYQTIPSLAHYVIVSPSKPRIEVFTRQDDGAWLLRSYGSGDSVALAAIDCAIEVDRIYTDVLEADA